ncbi:hypothetical protein MW887_007159 [Aspergillus wentii]|nr:hypothetical protein MW887_007159 [Aspergillus wentii]
MLPLTLLTLLPLISAQKIGTQEVHPQLDTWKCTSSNGCVKQDTSIVLDSATHWIHGSDGKTSCTTDDGLDSSLCPDKESCAKNCIIDGITDYTSYGVETSGESMHLRAYIKDGDSVKATSPRVYLLNEDGKNYDMLQLLNQEFTFDVDMSKLPCGMNGALYLSEMEKDGGRSDLNPAGAQYGTGYCDAQCPVASWVNGEANSKSVGACCNEMDIWEANARATGYTPHPCNVTSLYQCTDDDCGSSGVCDKSGCGYNPYALGSHDYYGYNKKVDTTKPFTVITQFVTNDNTTSGHLTEIRRQYIQNGKVIENAKTEVSGQQIDSMTDAYCSNSADYFGEVGGLKGMGKALGRGMVLTFSLWNDADQFMNWLDSGDAGPCNSTEGNPELIQKNHPDTAVTFSNIRWGDIGSTGQFD